MRRVADTQAGRNVDLKMITVTDTQAGRNVDLKMITVVFAISLARVRKERRDPQEGCHFL
jgi:hypothetical protein